MKPIEECSIECFSDASFANLAGSGSQGGFIIFLRVRDETGERCPVYWQTKKIRRVVKSTLSAEALALLDCAETAIHINTILSEITHCGKLEIICCVDNKSLVDAVYSSKRVDDHRLWIDIAVLQCMLKKSEINSFMGQHISTVG